MPKEIKLYRNFYRICNMIKFKNIYIKTFHLTHTFKKKVVITSEYISNISI